MKVLLSWLREYIDLPETPEEIATILTNLGLEVEGITPLVPTFRGVIAAKVIEASKHPQADKLTVAQVFDGKNTHQIVCGAKNCRKGIEVALAQIGAVLYPDGGEKPAMHVSKAMLRGVESHGMLCSAKELGLGDDHEGIIELQDIASGTHLENIFQDFVFEIGFTPNMSYAMSILGVARELAAFTGRSLKKQPYEEIAFSAPQKGRFTIELKNPDCPRYSALYLKNVTTKESPFWMRLRLERSGVRSVNRIVDVTNYVAHAVGEPMHAFDAARLVGNEIIVSKPEPKEVCELLDGTVKMVPEEACVIRDREKICAIGGVIGAKNSAVTTETQDVLFEAAYFVAPSIRRTRKALGVHTDSSKRFERGTDPRICVDALRYAYYLVKKMEPEAVLDSLYDCSKEQFSDKEITMRLSKASSILGFEVSATEAEALFSRLGFTTKWDGQDLFVVTVPPYRHDIQEEIDLVGEVSRLHGEKQESYAPCMHISSTLLHHPRFLFEREIRARLVTENLQEFLTCNLISPKMAEVVRNHPIDEEALVKVTNPMSEDQSILRPSMLPSLLDVVRRNKNLRILDVSGFEIGKVYLKRQNKYEERLVLGIILTGLSAPSHFSKENRNVDFFDLKGIVANFMRSLFISHYECRKSSLSIFHPGQQVEVYVGDLQVGSFGQLHPQVCRRFDVDAPVFFAEFDLEDLMRVTQEKEKPKYVPVAEFPASERDWTVTLDESVPYEKIQKSIEALCSPLLESLSLVAIFRHEKLGADKKNVTLHFVYRDKGKTVSQQEVDAEHDRIIGKVIAALSA